MDHQLRAEFQSKSYSDGLDALKRCLDPGMGHKGLIGAKNRKTLKLSLEKSYTIIIR